jgi:pyruvate/2-oxoglutarate dehydrogenase complex dihydrolipoamide acyltransferase (E2) component
MSKTDGSEPSEQKGFMNSPENRTSGFRCFECNEPAQHAHHVVPFVLGGTRTLPLCESCHGKVHQMEFDGHSSLIKEGMAQAKAQGTKLGRPVKVDVTQIFELRSQGLSFRRIAKSLNISPSSVCVALKSGSNGK